MIENDSEFIRVLTQFKHKFETDKTQTESITMIKNRIDNLYSIVVDKKEMPFLQVGYSYIRPFTDLYEEAIDFFKTPEGLKLQEVLNYFAYKFNVPENQKTGFNKNSKSN